MLCRPSFLKLKIPLHQPLGASTTGVFCHAQLWCSNISGQCGWGHDSLSLVFFFLFDNPSISFRASTEALGFRDREAVLLTGPGGVAYLVIMARWGGFMQAPIKSTTFSCLVCL